MSVYRPAKSRFFHYDFVSKGRRFCGSTECETRRNAEQVERNIRAKVALGVDPSAEMTLDEAAGRWWSEVGQHLGAADDMKRRVGVVLRLLGKSTAISDITTAKVSTAIEKRRGETYRKSKAKGAKRYPVSNATVNADVPDTLRRILVRARDVWEVKGLHAINWKGLRLDEPDPEVRFYSQAQQAAWLAECDDAVRFALQMLLTYGLRLGELFFKPEGFDPGDGVEQGPRLTINKRKNKPHLLPLREDDARQVAARVGRAKAAGLETIWFEENSAGELEPLTYYGVQARLRSAAKRAGVDCRRVIHGARHHAGTMTVSKSKNLKLAQQLLGHVSLSSTMRYAHALEDDLRAALEGISRNSPEPPADPIDFVVPKQRRRR